MAIKYPNLFQRLLPHVRYAGSRDLDQCPVGSPDDPAYADYRANYRFQVWFYSLLLFPVTVKGDVTFFIAPAYAQP
jgi:hypothetical protein